MTVALSSDATLAWWLTLAAGLVVALVVWGLLEALRREVKAIRDGVDAVLSMGGRLAQNTQAIHLFSTTKARGVDLLTELEHHRTPAERRQA